MAPLKPNFQRMLQLIDEVFSTRNDPNQIQVTPQQLKKLEEIHPATRSEVADENGPVIWVLIIPTTSQIMNDFLANRISEKGILEKTNPGDSYDCIYLCSVTTLPEYRGKGKTKAVCISAIKSVCKTHPVTTLFVWPFTNEGDALAESLTRECGLKLIKALF